MRFIDLTISGFCSFSPKPQKIRLSKRGLTLVEGDNKDDNTVANNGSGKSSIPLAVLWCLFGKTGRPDLTGDAVINRHAVKKGCFVRLKIKDEGRKVYITRYRGHPEHKNNLVLDPMPSASDNRTTQELVNDIVGMDFDTFVNSVIFGQEQMVQFAAMTDKAQKALLDRFVGIESISAAHKSARVSLQDLDDKIEKVKGSLVDTDETKEELKESKESSRNWRKKQDARIRELEKATKIKDVSKEKELVKEAKKTAADLRALQDEQDRVVENARDGKTVASDKVESLTRELKKAEKLSTGKCRECGTELDEKHVKKHISEAKEKLAEAEEKLKEAGKWYTAAKEVRDSREKKIEDVEANIEPLEQFIRENEAAEKANAGSLKLIEELKSEENPHRRTIRRLKKKLAEDRASNASLEDRVKQLELEQEHLTFITDMLSDKGGAAPPLKGLILDSVAPFLNKQINHYAKRLTDGNIRVTFDTQRQLKSGDTRDEYALTASDKYGAEIYGGLSKGQRRKVDIAVFLAFRSLAASRARKSVNVAWWDEVFDALDETAQEVMVELLLEEKKRQESLFVITQRPELRAYFPKVIRVTKRKGFTTVSE